MKTVEKPNAPPSPGAMRIVWLSMLSSLAVYVLIGILVAPKGGLGHAVIVTFTAVLAVVAFAEVSAVMALGSTLAARTSGPAFAIVRWGIAESIAVYGLVLRMLGASLSTMIAFVAASAAVLVLWRPVGKDS
jgi:hypothetical protein